ncbi:MAG: hypothetical protein MUF83_18205 [Acidimicrobiales bacterium]|jgi:hypothetical protein|nr:hypothetical protein [Acidimicrobiales bacterium]
MEPARDEASTEQFLAEIADIRLKSAGRHRQLLRLGAVLMPTGIVLGIVAWFLAYNTDSALEQRDAIILALIGVSVSVTGMGLFLRYSFGEFLRFWMARLVYQQQVGAAGRPADRPAE